jgi:hypothetical protein
MTIKISKEDKALIRAYVKWYLIKYEDKPTESEVSRMIDNMNTDHRYLVEDFIESL